MEIHGNRLWNEFENLWPNKIKTARFVEHGTKEWHDMWAMLATLPINVGLERPTEAPHYGECWQYMGTWDEMHEFRHRAHPVTEQREYAMFKAEGEQNE